MQSRLQVQLFEEWGDFTTTAHSPLLLLNHLVQDVLAVHSPGFWHWDQLPFSSEAELHLPD